MPKRIGLPRGPVVTLMVMLSAIFFFSAPVPAHPELRVRDIETFRKKKPSRRTKEFQLRPIFLSPPANVHETMTAASINRSGILGREFDDVADVGFIKGVYWNDSPERGLCSWCPTIEANRGALRWYKRFRAAQKSATSPRNPQVFTHGHPVFERSHFGDLAFIHAMATKDGIPARETKLRAMAWAEFTYKVAVGNIREDVRVREVSVTGFEHAFNARDSAVYDKRLDVLFGDKNVKLNAIGSLLHLVQDAFSPAHVERVNVDHEEGRYCRTTVIRFLAYPSQSEKKHSEADKWPPELILDKIKARPRNCDPISVGAALLKLYQGKESWERAKLILESSVFSLRDELALSGPGAYK